MFTRQTACWPIALFFLGAVAAHAHDTLQSSTNVWLQPDKMEVELILSRTPSRALLDQPPPVPPNDANFESTFHTLFQECAPSLLDITLDGKKMEPGSITVELFQDTDLRFDYIFPRPAHGTLSITATFVKRMPDGYTNSLGVNEGNNVLGFASQDTDQLTWAINLGDPPPAPQSPTPAAKLPEGSPAQKSHILLYAALSAALGLFVAWNLWRISQKSRRNS
jgi:hypothetical protein